MIGSLLILGLIIQAPALSVSRPLEVVGYSDGAEAAIFDPAGAAWGSGLEFHAAGSLQNTTSIDSSSALFMLLPLGALRLQLGWDSSSLDNKFTQRGSLGMALRFRRIAFGATYRRLWSDDPADPAYLLDFSASARPSRYLSLGMGVAHLNRFGTDKGPSAELRAGFALRPLWGESWLTLAADVRMPEREAETAGRFLVDVEPLSGVHLLSSYSFSESETRIFGGLGITFGELDMKAAMGSDHGDISSWYGLNWRSEARGSVGAASPAIVELRLGGNINEPANDGLFTQETLAQWPLILNRVAQDPDVEHLLIRLSGLRVAMATVEELRCAIKTIQKAGKFVTVELTGATDKTYMVAAAADKIHLDPAGTLAIDGFAVTSHYFADALNKFGVRVDTVEIGEFKSGADFLTHSEPRKSDEEFREKLLSEAMASLKKVLKEDRGFSERQVTEILSRGGFSAREALALGLVDELTLPTDPAVVPPLRPAFQSAHNLKRASNRWGPLPRIAIIPVLGTIVGDAGDNIFPGPSAVSGSIVSWLDAARRDDDIKAIVLRVDSPGGEVFASDVIWRAVRRAAAAKPLVVSMGDLAASGGYYVSAPAAYIFAQPSTLTGSIGIFTMKPDLSSLYDYIGVKSVVYSEGEHADWDGMSHPLRDHDRARLRHLLEAHYDDFVSKVAVGRNMKKEKAFEVAEGRVFTGLDALDTGLVDAIGGLNDAILEAKKRAGLDGQSRVSFWIPTEAVSLTEMGQGIVMIREPLKNLARQVRDSLQSMDGKAMALMPRIFEVGF
ncbi:signal peptide peptidase SppA [Myxococcota bacterium]|nr:signal peptide peptidase SppA [Myxococcota bacterium]